MTFLWKANKNVKSKVNGNTIFSPWVKMVESNFLLCLDNSAVMMTTEK